MLPCYFISYLKIEGWFLLSAALLQLQQCKCLCKVGGSTSDPFLPTGLFYVVIDS